MNAIYLFFFEEDWTGIENTASQISSSVSNLCYVLFGVFGLAGSIRIYNKWQLGGCRHLHIDAEVAGWFGAALFFLAANTIIEVVF